MICAHRLDQDEGFSMVELLVAIVLVGVVSSAALSGAVRVSQISTETTSRVQLLTDMQRAQERLSRNIRAADPISAATATDLTFDVFDDTSTERTISYSLVAGELQQTIGPAGLPGVTTPLLTGLDVTAAPVFAYLAEDGAVWDGVAEADIREVVITLRAIERGADIEIVTSVFVRNTAVAER